MYDIRLPCAECGTLTCPDDGGGMVNDVLFCSPYCSTEYWARAALDPSSSGVSGSTDGNVSIPAENSEVGEA